MMFYPKANCLVLSPQEPLLEKGIVVAEGVILLEPICRSDPSADGSEPFADPQMGFPSADGQPICG